jgi:hypothetical protein
MTIGAFIDVQQFTLFINIVGLALPKRQCKKGKA